MTRHRTPAGVPSGGQFAASPHGEAEVSLAGPVDFSNRMHGEHVSIESYLLDERNAYVSNFVVAADRRGTGIGSAFVCTVLDAADDQGVTLHLHPGNARLQAYYERHGFVVNTDEPTLGARPHMTRAPRAVPGDVADG